MPNHAFALESTSCRSVGVGGALCCSSRLMQLGNPYYFHGFFLAVLRRNLAIADGSKAFSTIPQIVQAQAMHTGRCMYAHL